MNSIKDSGFFREYAFTNSTEFISVVMEYFFEDPKGLKTKFPDLYQRLKTMLNYDENCFSH
jgi:Mlc titration factor MtfA (ptsG expression regulator)